MTDGPNIHPEIDRLIDIIEAAGGSWNVLWGCSNIQPYLVFQLPETGDVAPAVLESMLSFDKMFRSDAEVRDAVFTWALSIGAAYVESGNDRPVLCMGATRQ
jgi:hypothetical protein